MRFLKSTYGRIAIGLYLVLILLTAILSQWWFTIFTCNGEWCSWGPLLLVSGFWAGILYRLLGNWYWFFGSEIVNVAGFLMNLMTVYWIGVLFERWRSRN